MKEKEISGENQELSRMIDACVAYAKRHDLQFIGCMAYGQPEQLEKEGRQGMSIALKVAICANPITSHSLRGELGKHPLVQMMDLMMSDGGEEAFNPVGPSDEGDNSIADHFKRMFN